MTRLRGNKVPKVSTGNKELIKRAKDYTLSYHMYEHPVVSWKLRANSVENSGSLHEIIVSENKNTKNTTYL